MAEDGPAGTLADRQTVVFVLRTHAEEGRVAAQRVVGNRVRAKHAPYGYGLVRGLEQR